MDRQVKELSRRTRISVVMPCHNAASFITESVDSVMTQTYTDVELIVVDDGSTDGSREMLRELADRYAPRITLLIQDRKGPFPARNLGLRHARGGLISFLDADDFWAPDCLEKLAVAIQEHHADIAYCGWQNVGVDVPAGREPYIPPDYASMDTAKEFLTNCPWPIHAALVRREAVEAVAGFSERYFSAMDYDFWLRLYAHTQRITRVPEVLAYYRWHDKGQISRNKWKQVLDAWRVRKEFVENHGILIEHVPNPTVVDLCDGWLLREAYAAYWRRDLVGARELFRLVLRQGSWGVRDLKYIMISLLPPAVSRALLGRADSKTEARQ